MDGPQASPVERRPGGVEDIAADECAVTLDRHAAERRATVVVKAAAHASAVAPDNDIGQGEPAALVERCAASIGLAARDRHAREVKRPTFDVEHTGPA